MGAFESWRSEVAVKESFPHNVLLTDNPNYFVLAFASLLVILLIATNGCLIVSSHGRTARVAVEESFRRCFVDCFVD